MKLHRESRSNRDKQVGSVLLVTILCVVVLTLIVGGYLEATTTELRNTHRQWHWNQTLDLAEAGLEIGISHVQAQDITGWAATTPGTYLPTGNPVSLIDTNGVSLGTCGIQISGYNTNNVTVRATGNLTTQPGTVVVKRTVKAILNRQKGGAINSQTTDVFAGSNIVVDSYDSTVGTYASQATNWDPVSGTFHANTNGSVDAFSASTPAINIANSTVWGNADTEAGGTVSSGPLGRISEGTVSNLDESTGFPVYSAPSGTYTNITIANANSTLTGSANPLTPTKFNVTSNVSLTGSHTLTINGYVILKMVSQELSISGNGKILLGTAASGAKIYIGGTVSISGNAVVNTSTLPAAFTIYGTNTTVNSWSVNGNGSWDGTIYAPNSNVTFNGGGGDGTAYGVIYGNQVNFNGNTKLHYDESLPNLLVYTFPYALRSWQEITPPVSTP